jgi:nucleoside-diphosphate-sugar epimerase
MKELAGRIFQKGKERGLVEGSSLKFDHVPIYNDDVKKRIPSVEKAQRDFDWNPEVKLDDSLDRCIDNIDNIYDNL